METYTIELRTLVNSGYNVFDDSWDTFVPDHKAVLCDKILRRYWFYEIGSETPERFKHYLNEQLARIMPYYNQLYESELIEILPLVNYFMEGSNEELRALTQNRMRLTRNDMNNVKNIANSLEKATQGLLTGVGSLKSNINATWREDRDGEDDRSIKQVHESTADTTEQWTEKDTTERTEKLDGSQTSEETMTDKTTGTKGIKTTGQSNSSSSQRYSDTPQAIINTQGQMTIENQYLTNYTANSANESTSGTQDETINSDETKNTNGSVTTDNNTTENTVTDKSGDKTIKQTESSSTDTTEHGTYSDDVVGSRDITRGDGTNEEKKTTGKENEFSNGSEQSTQIGTGAENDSAKDEETTTGTDKIKGFTVSQAELLNQYRQTFLNIDQQIIDALAENFMGVW